ncbi:MAG: TraR/DksA family transcriptional regulator [Bdellovibrionaceae bacterium]|nr:TraR/DksA family transcriptional regulator [Pseudobdellovibrionaceae bacterium]
MRTRDLMSIKKSLLEQKSAILNSNLNFLADQSSRTKLAEDAELASESVSENLSINLLERNLHRLRSIENALARIDSGTYGECLSCGDKISLQRLRVYPLTPYCLSCQEERETLSSLPQ